MMMGARNENQHQIIGLHTLLVNKENCHYPTRNYSLTQKSFATLLVITRVTSNFSLPYPTRPTRHSLLICNKMHAYLGDIRPLGGTPPPELMCSSSCAILSSACTSFASVSCFSVMAASNPAVTPPTLPLLLPPSSICKGMLKILEKKASH